MLIQSIELLTLTKYLIYLLLKYFIFLEGYFTLKNQKSNNEVN